MADSVRRRLHPDNRVTYIVDRNINPTNVCLTDCGFCAFYRPPGHPEAYVLSRDEIYRKVQETVDLGGQQPPDARRTPPAPLERLVVRVDQRHLRALRYQLPRPLGPGNRTTSA